MELQFTAKWGDGCVFTADCDCEDWEWDGGDLVDDIIGEWKADNPDVEAAEFELTENGRVVATMSWTRENNIYCYWH